MKLRFGLLLVSIGCVTAITAASASADTLTVCKHGCQYRTVQSAVNDVNKGKGTTIKVKPGTYKEGVRVVGHKYDDLTFVGDQKHPNKVVLNGKNAKVIVPDRAASSPRTGSRA